MKEQIVAQVHKPVKSTTSSENDYANSEDNLESNRTYVKYEDKNENIGVHTPAETCPSMERRRLIRRYCLSSRPK
ncbi:hypothetical protein NQ317_016827 [Molorchus minor]|uniref:Uncharacterized protein n=1 Tax=Molorchus minor TaxID=1323400 RepID=A0ABQ9JNK6_9CUCU|nr:hypothetical protein NQ317_016827 [Molorchus minor]